MIESLEWRLPLEEPGENRKITLILAGEMFWTEKKKKK